jgi:hypothetical protein
MYGGNRSKLIICRCLGKLEFGRYCCCESCGISVDLPNRFHDILDIEKTFFGQETVSGKGSKDKAEGLKITDQILLRFRKCEMLTFASSTKVVMLFPEISSTVFC